MTGDHWLEIRHHENRVEDKDGFLVMFCRKAGRWGGAEVTETTYADYAPFEGAPHYPEWPQSLWGLFPTQSAARDAVAAAGLMDKLNATPQA
jgi:hypothetical protein